METLEITKPKQEKYIDLNQYKSIPALDEALAEPDEPEVFHTWEEYIDWQNKFLNEDD